MKYLIFTTIFFTLLGCNSNKPETPNNDSIPIAIQKTELIDSIEIKEKINNSVQLNPQIAIDFLNGYIEDCNNRNTSLGIIEWTKATPLATENFKNELDKLIAKAEEEDPEMGLGFDPIFDAQDYPEDGVELLDFDSISGYITLKGIKWKNYTVTLKIINQNNQTLVDGCGVINIPEDKRTER